MSSGVTLDGNEHRKQAKQRRKRAFVNSLKGLAEVANPFLYNKKNGGEISL